MVLRLDSCLNAMTIYTLHFIQDILEQTAQETECVMPEALGRAFVSTF